MIQNIDKDLVVFNGNQMDNNAYMLIDNQHCVIIDPSSYAQIIKDYVNKYKLIVDGILLTHGHYDHIETINDLIKEFKVKVYCYQDEEDVVNKYNCADMMSNVGWRPLSDYFVYFKGGELKLNNFKFEVFLTPGHTSGSVCYRYHHYFFTGDTIFYDSIGRWDLPTGDQNKLFNSVKKFIHIAKANDLILPGHGRQYVTYNELKDKNLYIIHFDGGAND